MKALLELPQEVNQTLNIIKAQYNLKNKAQTITLVTNTFKHEHMEPELRPEFVDKLNKTEQQKGIRFSSVNDLRKRHT